MISSLETKKLKVLLIEDNPRDVRLIRAILSEVRGTSFDLEWFNRLSDGLERLSEGGIDLVLLDLSLPDSKWSETFQRVHAKAPRVPIVVLTSMDSDALSLETVRNGAQDYLVKGEVDNNSFVRTVRYAIERQRMQDELRNLYLRMEKNLNQTESLMHFSRKINTTLNLADLYQVTKDTIPGLFHAELFSVFLLAPESRQLKLTVHNHADWDRLPESFIVHENESIMWDAIKNREPIRIENFSEDRYAKPWDRKKYENESAICVPLVAHNEVLGVLNLNDLTAEGMSEDNMANIERVCDHLSLAIYNSVLLDRIAEMTIRDELTQLYNRRHFGQTVTREVESAKRYGEKFSLVMVDLDHFKQINDTYGHVSGDLVLKKVAEHIRSNLRPTDVACRLGGDEFILILPQTTGSEAVKLAERFRQDLAAQDIRTESGRDLRITVSVGVVEHGPGEELDALLNRVDSALYSAKQKGRNTSTFA